MTVEAPTQPGTRFRLRRPDRTTTDPEPTPGRDPCFGDREAVVRQGDPMRYTLGCSLSYNILSDTTFIFNLEVAKLKSVEILSESLVLTPNLKRDLYTTPDLQNRYLAVNVPTGQFALEYNAE